MLFRHPGSAVAIGVEKDERKGSLKILELGVDKTALFTRMRLLSWIPSNKK
jgi:hypothetical protein